MDDASHGNDGVVFVALEREGRREELHAWAADLGLRSWAWGRADGADKAMRELLAFSEGRPLASLQGERLAELLSRPEVLSIARPALGRLRDLGEVGLVLGVGYGKGASPPCPLSLADGAREEGGKGDGDGNDASPPGPLSLADGAREEGENGDGDGVLTPRPPLLRERRSGEGGNGDGEAVPVQVWEVVWACEAVLRTFGEADEEFVGVLGPLLATDAAFSWLPWPEGSGELLGIMQIGGLLPKKPPARKREADDAGPAGDLADVAADILSPGGAIEAVLEAYEHRPGQVEMAREVAEGLRDESFVLAEAGTGVGKSLAYLVPAVLWARREGQPVVISTNTKNLQEQLIGKDLPLLREALGVAFEAALLKGRGNYPCVRALVNAAVDAASGLFRSERLAVAHLLAWLMQSATGDLDEVSPAALEALGELQRLVGRVRSQGEACLGRGCSQSDSCPVEIARSFARRADVIVSNHALTFADARTTVFPPYSRLIFDEAHNVESAATEGLARECSTFGVSQLARRLVGDASSLVRLLEKKLGELGSAGGAAEALEALKGIPEATEEMLSAVGEFGAILCDFCLLASQDSRVDDGRSTVRLTPQVRALPEWQETVILGTAAYTEGMELFSALAHLVALLRDVDKGGRPGAEGMDADAYGIKTRIEEQMMALATVLNSTGDSGEYVTWAETWRSARGQQWSVHAAPVDVGPPLDEAVYQHKPAIVFTSATMTVDGEFKYFRQRLGLDEYQEKLRETRAASPFDLMEQLLLCIPTDLPDAGERNFNDATVDALRSICEVTRGGTLALFTARSRMKQAYQRLESELEALGLTPLCQDVSGPRWALLDRLREDPTAVLFGLKSFWEGIDVPGDALRCVVICKLPFAVPSDPIIEARQEDALRKGLNPMNDYYIPEAVIGFKQGFGRLIRTTTDTGVVFVLDKRILTKGYGKRFFKSIQRCELVRDSLEECLDSAKGWLRGRQA